MATHNIFDIEEDLDFIVEKPLPEWVMKEPKPIKKLYPKSFVNWNLKLLNATYHHTKDPTLKSMILDELTLRDEGLGEIPALYLALQDA